MKLGLSFSIKRFLHFSINFKYLITRLADFPDPSAHFEAYTEFYFPGLLFLRQRGDRIRFGYESPEGGEVPASCQIIYRCLPNIIYLRKNPGHIIELNPGKNNNNSKLILLLGYTNFNINKTVIINVLIFFMASRLSIYYLYRYILLLTKQIRDRFNSCW